MKPILILALSPLVLAVAACGALQSGSMQTVTIETPGSKTSTCILDNGNRYKAVGGQPITIMRSGNDLKVDCYGTSDRQKSVVVESTFNDWSIGNVATGIVPGMAYDYASNGLYVYPDVITVNFSDMVATGFDLPQYHDKEMPNPYDTSIESYGASTIKLPKDSTFLKRGIEKRNDQADMNPFDGFYGANSAPSMTPSNEGSVIPSDVGVTTPSVPTKTSPSPTTPKPVIKGRTAEELNRNMNPSVFGQ